MPRELSENKSSGHDFSACLAAALRFMSYRPRTVQEVRQRMSRRFTSETVDQTIDYLVEAGYLDDSAFSSQWISSRERRRPKGARALQYELTRLGVDRATIEDALADYDEATNAYRAALRPAERLAAQQCSYHDFRRKVGEYLMRRGFAYSAISATVARLWSELVED